MERPEGKEEERALHTYILAYVAKIMTVVECHEGIRCGWLLEHADRPCGEPATYLVAGGDLVASDTPVDAGGDVKSGPQWLCWEHMLGASGAGTGRPPGRSARLRARN